MANSKGLNRDFYLISEAYTKKLNEAMSHSPSQLSVPNSCEACAGDEEEEGAGSCGCTAGEDCSCATCKGSRGVDLRKKLDGIRAMVDVLSSLANANDVLGNLDFGVVKVIDDAHSALYKLAGGISIDSEDSESDPKGSYTSSYVTMGSKPPLMVMDIDGD